MVTGPASILLLCLHPLALGPSSISQNAAPHPACMRKCVCVCVCAYLMNLVEVIVYDLALCRRSKMVKRKKERERQRGSERDRERGREIERERERNRERGRAPLDE